jgi:hypothetical protein
VIPMRDQKMQQQHSEVVNLNGWEPDDEFPIGPVAAKPKQTRTRALSAWLCRRNGPESPDA